MTSRRMMDMANQWQEDHPGQTAPGCVPPIDSTTTISTSTVASSADTSTAKSHSPTGISSISASHAVSEGDSYGSSSTGIYSGVTSIDVAHLCTVFYLLSWRAGSEQLRDVPTLITRLAVTIVFACIIGGMYSDTADDQESIGNKTGLLFIIAINQGAHQGHLCSLLPLMSALTLLLCHTNLTLFPLHLSSSPSLHLSISPLLPTPLSLKDSMPISES